MTGLLRALKNNLLKGFASYFGASIVNKAIPFLLLPILTKYLSTNEYGILAIYQVMISFGMPLVGMSMQNNITRDFFQKSKKFIARLLFNLIVVLWFTSTVLLILIGAYLGLGGSQFSIPQRWLYALPLIALMNMINSFNLTLLRNRKRAIEFGAFEITKTAFDLSITIVLIVYYSYGWQGRAIGIFVGTFLMGIISFLRIWHSGFILFKIDFSQIKGILKISLPLLPHAIGGVIITLSDRIFINQMVSTSAVGIYTVGYQFGMIMTLIVTAFNRSWSPWMYEQLAKESGEDKAKIVKATYLISIGYICLALLITVGSYVFLPLMTATSYHGGTVFVIWIAMGYALNGIYTLVFPYGVHIGNTSYLGITTLIAAVTNLIANYYLIRLNGALGAAQATLISYLIILISVWWYSNKLYPMPWFSFSSTEN